MSSSGAQPSTVHRPSTFRVGRSRGSHFVCRTLVRFSPLTNKRSRPKRPVFAWELWNEIDAADGDGWMEWTREMLGEVHARFPNQMAVQSVGSLDHFRKRLLFTPVWKMEGNDFAQVDRYLDTEARLAACRGPVDIMAADAIKMVRDAGVTGKPIVLAETGAVEPAHTGPSDLYENDRMGTILHDVVFAPFFAGSAGPGQIWHWNTYVERHNLWHHFGHFAKMVEGIDPPAEKFLPGQLDHERMRVYTLRGKKTLLIWCRDKNAGWRAELEEMRVRPVDGAVLDLGDLREDLPAGRVRILNPWSGEWTESQVVDGKIQLPVFLRSVVVRIDN